MNIHGVKKWQLAAFGAGTYFVFIFIFLFLYLIIVCNRSKGSADIARIALKLSSVR